MTVVFRLATAADYSEVQRITREAYLHAGHFAADHPYMSALDDVEHRAKHAEVWVAESSGAVVAAVTLTFAGQPYSEIAMENELEFRILAVDPAVQGGGVGRAVVRRVIEHAESLPNIRAISITSATFMERAHALYESLGFQRVPTRDLDSREYPWLCPQARRVLPVKTIHLLQPDSAKPCPWNLTQKRLVEVTERGIKMYSFCMQEVINQDARFFAVHRSSAELLLAEVEH